MVHPATKSGGMANDADPAPESVPDVRGGSAWTSLLERLETSMRVSQRALLSQDVNALERMTAEQRSTLTELRARMERERPPACLQAAQRVLEVGRVLEFLIGRMQRKLMVAANCRAAAQPTYQPPDRLRAG